MGAVQKGVESTRTDPAAGNHLWVQFFEQKRRRDQKQRRNQRQQNKQRRNFDSSVPLRTAPVDKQLRKRELRRRDRNRKERQDQDDALKAVRRGEILSLEGIIPSVQSSCPGKFLGARLQRGRNGFSYVVKILRPSGRRIGLTVDAQTGDVIGGRCR
jgi:uncharacterized membrane protein YkoI